MCAVALGSCSANTAGAGASSGASPTVTPDSEVVTPAPAPDPFDTTGFSLTSDTQADWAAYADGYVFSEFPQSVGEQFIYDNYPEMWTAGVRVLSGKYMEGMMPNESAYGVVVLYQNGVRFEGSDSMPLGLRGNYTADLTQMPSDAAANISNGGFSKTWEEGGNGGQGGYNVTLDQSPQGITKATFYYGTAREWKVLAQQTFSSLDEALAAVKGGSAFPDLERRYFLAEIATVYASLADTDGDDLGYGAVYNPSSGTFVPVNSNRTS